MSKSDDRRLDAYLAGDLSPQEERAFAQASLDDPELFDQLASAATVNAAAANAAVTARRSKMVRPGWMLLGAAAAVATIVAAVSIDRWGSTPPPAPTTTASGRSTPSAAEPGTRPPRAASQPVLLAARLAALAEQSPEFRSPTDASRAPKSSGVVVSVEGSEVGIDLGSLDGLTKGSEVQVARAGASTPPRLTITTVFRERSRGRTASLDVVRAGDRIEVPPDLQLSALFEHVLSRIAAGDADAARTAARQAVAVSATVTGSESFEAMNELAAVLISSRDYMEAETLLRRAQVRATGVTAVRVANNLAAIAALRGDVGAAESMYRSALASAGKSPELESARGAIEKNLEALRSR
jgi:hypothetical protein